MKGLLLLALAVVCCLASVQGYSFPKSHAISNIPYHRQITTYYCGDASLQMAYQYTTGKMLSQDHINDVARTSELVGTLKADMIRASRFSRLSSAASHSNRTAWDGSGYPGVSFGLSAVGYNVDDQSRPWMDLLKETISKDIPVIVLQHYLPTDLGGHYRLAFAYNETHIITKDPWDRDDLPREFAMSNQLFEQLWWYNENEGPEYGYWGMAILPWFIKGGATRIASRNGLPTYQVNIQFTYSSPFDTSLDFEKPVATNVMAEIEFDQDTWALVDGDFSTKLVATSMFMGDSQIASWNLQCISTPTRCSKMAPKARASGIIQSNVSQTVRTENTQYPAYQYIDQIGSLDLEIPIRNM